MSPEQCRNSSEVTDRADIYSLGVLCYWLLAGVHPFRGTTDMAIIMQHLTATAPSLYELAPSTPRPVSDLVDAMLAKTASERPSAREVVNVLSPLLKGPASHNSLPAVGPAPASQVESSGQIPRPTAPVSSGRAAPAATAAPSAAAGPGSSRAVESALGAMPLIVPAAPPRAQRHPRIDPDSTAKSESVIGALGHAAALARESAAAARGPAAAPAAAALPVPTTEPRQWTRPVAIAAGLLLLIGLLWWLVLGSK
jgi:serine/threonine-protein kinase